MHAAGRRPHAAALRADEAARIVAIAIRAPSLHNSQPWMFVLRGGALELRADSSRHLPGTDPDTRQMLLSCGAALFGARLGVRALGYLPHVDLLPEPSQPELLARIHVRGEAPAEPEDEILLRALPWRCSLRSGFAPAPVRAGLVTAMRRAAARERAVLLILDDPVRRRAAAEIVAAADLAQAGSAQAARELRTWTTRPPADADGVPSWAYPARPSTSRAEEFVVRDFAQTFRPDETPELLPPEPPADSDRANPPVAAALITRGDAPADWLHAGQALHRVLLTAAAEGVQASLHSQPFGPVDLRHSVRQALTDGAEPQLLLQFGHPVRRNAVGPATPRRPVADVLTVAESSAET